MAYIYVTVFLIVRSILVCVMANNQAIAALPKFIRDAQHGSRQAYGEIYRILLPKIYRFVWYEVRDKATAEDLTQVTFLRLWKAINSYDTNKGSFPSFAFAIARNLIIDWQRKKRTVSLEAIGEVEERDDTVERLIQHDTVDRVRGALAKLSMEDRQLVVLRHFEDMPYEDIAKAMGKREGAVRVKLHRILRTLKGILKESL